MKKNVDKQFKHWKRRRLIRVYTFFTVFICAAARQNQQYGQCAQRRRRSVWASAQSDQFSLCAQWVANDPILLLADGEDSDQAKRMTLISKFCKQAEKVIAYGYHVALNNILLLSCQRLIILHRLGHYATI